MLIDSNIIIYSIIPENLPIRNFLRQYEDRLFVSAISQIEVLGYHNLLKNEKYLLEQFFLSVNIIPIHSEIVAKAIELRQKKKLSIGDSIIASTSIVNQLTLFTNNEQDFQGFLEEKQIITLKSILEKEDN
jgi:toxin FitB